MEPRHKNITILIGQLVAGGAEKQSLLLAKALSGQYTVRYLVLKPFKIIEAYLDFLKGEGLNYEILHGSLLRRMVRLTRLLRSTRTEILFCYLPGDNLAGTLAGKFARVPWIIGGIRNTKIVRRKYYPLRFVQNHFQNYVIFNSTRAMDIFCSKGYRKAKCRVIENAIAEQLDFFERPESDLVRILMVGRFVGQKDYHTGIRAVAGLSELVARKRIRLVIAGYGTMEDQIRDWIREYGLEALTEIHIQASDLPELYRTSDIYLNSSVHEGFSNSVMEAMAHGLPVVATLSGDIEKQVVHGTNGYIAQVGDHSELCHHLEELCRDHPARIRFGREGHHRLYEYFGLDSFREKYFSFIHSLE